jgi:imidazolonepropionase-like amidohydrolase
LLDRTKGSVEVGKDADVMLLDKKLGVDTVFAKGKPLVMAGQPVVRGRLEEAYLGILK